MFLVPAATSRPMIRNNPDSSALLAHSTTAPPAVHRAAQTNAIDGMRKRPGGGQQLKEKGVGEREREREGFGQ